MDSLMVCIPDPGQCAQDRDSNSNVREYSHDQYCVVVGTVTDKDQDYFEYQPREARECASRVNPSKML